MNLVPRSPPHTQSYELVSISFFKRMLISFWEMFFCFLLLVPSISSNVQESSDLLKTRVEHDHRTL